MLWHGVLMQTTNRARILFILFIVLGVYYPVIFAGVNSVDDYKMISILEDMQRIDWKGLFVPGGGGIIIAPFLH